MLTIFWSACCWLFRPYRPHDQLIDTLIVPIELSTRNRVEFRQLDEGARERTAKRRAVADSIRGRAAHVETGATAGAILRLAKGGEQ